MLKFPVSGYHHDQTCHLVVGNGIMVLQGEGGVLQTVLQAVVVISEGGEGVGDVILGTDSDFFDFPTFPRLSTGRRRLFYYVPIVCSSRLPVGVCRRRNFTQVSVLNAQINVF